MRYLEDFPLNETRTLGSYRVTAEEIVAFAKDFDPQPFHLDEAAAKASPFGGLVASGWHSAAISQRLLVKGFATDAVSYGSPGVDELRFVKPVRPGDTLTLQATIIEAKPSRSKPDRGLLRIRTELLNQHGEVVLTMIGLAIFGRRPGADQKAM